MSMKITKLPLLVTVVVTVAVPVVAGDWVGWRGPNRDGVSTESGWRSDWSSRPPEVTWKAEVGVGFSAVSVSDGRLYTMGRSAVGEGGKKDGGKDTVYCFDAADGSKVWTYSYSCKLVDNLHDGGPAATPTVDDGKVYTLSKEGHLFCFEKSKGKIEWQKELAKALGVKMPGWGFSSSPLVHGELLILDAGPLVAFDRKTGDLRWKTRPYVCGYGSPVPFEVDGAPQVAHLNNDGLLVCRLPSGETADLLPWKTSFATNGSTPVIAGGSIFISTGYKRGCSLVEFANGKLRGVYENKNMNNHINSCVLRDGHLYGIDGNSNDPRRTIELVCLEAKTGTVKWKKNGFGCGSLMAADGKLIVLSDSGELAIVEARPDAYHELARHKVLDGRCWTVPVLANGRIYCRNSRGRLVCVDVRAGK